MNTRTKREKILRRALFVGALLFAGLVSRTAPAAISAELSAPKIGPGGVTYLTLQLEGSEVELPDQLNLGPLRIVSRSQQSSVTMGTGGVHRTTALVLGITTDKPGSYEIGPLAVKVDGRFEATEPVELKVEPGAGSGGAPPFSGLGSMMPSPRAPDPTPSPAEPGALARVRLRGVPRRLTLGESEPIRIEAWFRGGTGVLMEKPPEIPGTDFVVERIDDEPKERQETDEDGVPYTVLTWRARIRPIRSGRMKLAVRMPVRLRYREAGPGGPRLDPMQHMQRLMSRLMRQGPSAGAMLNQGLIDELFRDDFFEPGRIREVKRTLKTARRLEVTAPPEEGRPEGFTGAVGQFELMASADRTEVKVGEPITLTFRVEGRGSFDRIESLEIPKQEGLRTYAPSAHTEPGAKIFEQPIVVTEPGQREIPAVSFDYFDPRKGSYQTARSEPIRIQVAPAPGAPIPAVSGAAPVSEAPAVTPYRRIYDRPSFFAGAGAAGVLGLLLFAAGLIRRRRADPEHRALRRMNRELRQLRRAVTGSWAGDDFVERACAYVRARLGRTFGVAPGAITAKELSRTTVPAPRIRALFEAEDALRYGRGAPLPEDAADWFEAIERELDAIREAEEDMR